MAGVPAHRRDGATVRDIKLLQARGLPMAEVAKRLGMSRATAYRILKAGTYHGNRGKR